MNAAIIIPARYRSSRFPGKPLVDLCGKPMIVRVWERCCQALPASRVYVATDDDRIAGCCRDHGIQHVMTSSTCLTGTDRVHEASLQIDADVYLNVQGDEPLILPGDIHCVLEEARKDKTVVYNATCPITSEEEYFSLSVPKVVFSPSHDLLYMSRAAIPGNKLGTLVRAWKQVCIYAFDRAALALFASSTVKTPLEQIEDIEILRFLELGKTVRMVPVSQSSMAVDSPQDAEKVIAILRSHAPAA